MLPPDDIIARTVLFADPEKSLVKISPDGKMLSFLAPHNGILNLWVAQRDHWDKATPLSSVAHPIKEYWWSADSQRLLFIHDENGNENWQLWSIHLKEGVAQRLTDHTTQVKVLQISSKFPDQILIALNERDKCYHDVYLLDLRSSQRECIYENHEYWEFISDDQLQLRFGIKVEIAGGKYIDLLSPEKRCVVEVAQYDLFGWFFYPRLRIGLSADGKKLYYIQTVQTNTSTLFALDLENQQTLALGHEEQADICDVLLCSQTKTPLAYATNYARKVWKCLNEKTQRDFEMLQTLDDGDIDIISQSEDNRYWIVAFNHDQGAISYYYYDQTTLTAKRIGTSHNIKQQTLTKMHPREIKTRDGLTCMSFLSLPRQSDLHEKGVPFQPVPLVLLVHGGPNFRDYWGFNPFHQWLANRGYAVLSVNFRASTGYGKAHLLAGHGEWGRKIHHDLLDAVQWAIDNRIAMPDKIAIMGTSFGGYSTLVGLTQSPESFCCGVDLVGPANLETMAKSFPPYWQAMQGVINEMLGCDPDTEEGKAYLKERSPLYFADHITQPLLMGHGTNDVRVMQNESDQMVRAMQKNKVPVTYVVFPDEGHKLMLPGNRIAFYALAEKFLAKNLGGRFEQAADPFPTSLTVKTDDFHLNSSK